MPKYTVRAVKKVGLVVEVEADNPEKAIEKSLECSVDTHNKFNTPADEWAVCDPEVDLGEIGEDNITEVENQETGHAFNPRLRQKYAQARKITKDGHITPHDTIVLVYSSKKDRKVYLPQVHESLFRKELFIKKMCSPNSVYVDPGRAQCLYCSGHWFPYFVMTGKGTHLQVACLKPQGTLVWQVIGQG